MSKHAEIILTAHATFRADDELSAAAKQAVDAYVRTFGQVAGHVAELSGLCHKHGQTALMGRIAATCGQPTADAMAGGLANIRTLWEAESPYPFPDMPDEPVVVVEPEPTDPAGAI